MDFIEKVLVQKYSDGFKCRVPTESKALEVGWKTELVKRGKVLSRLEQVPSC